MLHTKNSFRKLILQNREFSHFQHIFLVSPDGPIIANSLTFCRFSEHTLVEMDKIETSNVWWHLEHSLYHLTECVYQLSSLWEIRLYKNKMLEIWHPKSEICNFCGFSHTVYCMVDNIRQFSGFCGPTRAGYVKIRDLKRPVAFRILSVSSRRVFLSTL